MKALTVKNPWAWCIVHAGKSVENRAQLWRYRGLLAIHSAKVDDPDALESPVVQRALMEQVGMESAPNGVVLGVVDLVDCHWAEDRGACSFACGPANPWVDPAAATHLYLRNPRPLPEPVPARGALGLWNLTDGVLAEVVRQLALSPGASRCLPGDAP